MDKNLFIPIYRTSAYTCMLCNAQFDIVGVTIPRGALLCYDRENRQAYFCTRFPKNYAGSPSSVILNVLWYDCDLHEIGSTTLKNCDISIALYNAWLNASKPKTRRVRHEIDYERMMDHDRKNKRGTGGVRLSAKSDEQTTDALHYNQVTEAAYWANLNNSKSGNASVVARSIR